MSTGAEALSANRPAGVSGPTPGGRANHSVRLPRPPVGLGAAGPGCARLAQLQWLFSPHWKGPGSVRRGHPRTHRSGDQGGACCWAPLNISHIREFLKCRSFRIHVNLNDYQFKTKYNYRSTYMNPITTTNQKPTIDTYTQKKKQFKQH